MAATTAVNTFALRPGVSGAQFEQFSRELDRPTCLALDEVTAFEVYLVQRGGGGPAVDVIEVMTVSDWQQWERVRDHAPQLRPVVARFEELVDTSTVVTYLTRHSSSPES